MEEKTGIATLLEGLIREIVRQEITAALANRQPAGVPGASPPSRWMTPPAAAREVGVSEKVVRAMIKDGSIVPRLRNLSANPKQPKFLVNVDDVAKVAQRYARPPSEPRLTLAERATRIRAAGGREES